MSEIAFVKLSHPIVYCTVYSMYSNVFCDLNHERRIMSEMGSSIQLKPASFHLPERPCTSARELEKLTLATILGQCHVILDLFNCHEYIEEG